MTTTDTRTRIVYVFPMDAPLSLQGSTDPEVRRLAALHERYIGPLAYTVTGDREDWLENAYRLDAGLRGFGTDNTWVVTHGHTPQAVHAGTGERISASSLDPSAAITYGPRSGTEHVISGASLAYAPSTSDRLADAYYRLPGFQEVARRELLVTSLRGDDPNNAAKLIGERVRDGGRSFYLKGAMAKSYNGFVNVPSGADRNTVDRLLLGALREMVYSMAEYEDSLLVQDVVLMQYEYRLFVVDGRIVSGAGCIEEHTPLERDRDEDGAFDLRVRPNRHDADSPVLEAPGVVDRLVTYGAQSVAELRRHTPELKDFVIDVALDMNGSPLVVELNPITNSGLYASDPVAVTEALVARG